MAQVWLVTGSSRGLGRAIVEAGLAAGNKVLAASGLHCATLLYLRSVLDRRRQRIQAPPLLSSSEE
jgi:NAD(P)-dependent dehydrogenase (short-subunit alcohol dehydrogenase family)